MHGFLKAKGTGGHCFVFIKTYIPLILYQFFKEFQANFSFDNKFIVILNFGYSNQLKGGMYCDIINKNIMAEKED